MEEESDEQLDDETNSSVLELKSHRILHNAISKNKNTRINQISFNLNISALIISHNNGVTILDLKALQNNII